MFRFISRVSLQHLSLPLRSLFKAVIIGADFSLYIERWKGISKQHGFFFFLAWRWHGVYLPLWPCHRAYKQSDLLREDFLALIFAEV